MLMEPAGEFMPGGHLHNRIMLHDKYFAEWLLLKITRHLHAG
jgi:hypothetical protein